MTKDPIVQFVIENSKEFKNGFIILVMSQDIAGEHPRMSIPKPKPAPTTEAPVTETPATLTIPAEETPASPKTEAESANHNQGTTPAGVVTVTCLDDAKEYLVEHCDMKRTELRSAKAIKDAAEKHGIVFEGI
jgi:hypothetical protein